MGGGIIIQQNDAVMKAVTSPPIMQNLPAAAQERVNAICAKGCAEWTEEDYMYMVSMLSVARG